MHCYSKHCSAVRNRVARRGVAWRCGGMRGACRVVPVGPARAGRSEAGQRAAAFARTAVARAIACESLPHARPCLSCPALELPRFSRSFPYSNKCIGNTMVL